MRVVTNGSTTAGRVSSHSSEARLTLVCRRLSLFLSASWIPSLLPRPFPSPPPCRAKLTLRTSWAAFAPSVGSWVSHDTRICRPCGVEIPRPFAEWRSKRPLHPRANPPQSHITPRDRTASHCSSSGVSFVPCADLACCCWLFGVRLCQSSQRDERGRRMRHWVSGVGWRRERRHSDHWMSGCLVARV